MYYINLALQLMTTISSFIVYVNIMFAGISYYWGDRIKQWLESLLEYKQISFVEHLLLLENIYYYTD